VGEGDPNSGSETEEDWLSNKALIRQSFRTHRKKELIKGLGLREGGEDDRKRERRRTFRD